VGNSISLGYVPVVSSLLEGKANCDHLATSRSIEDPSLFKETRIAMGRYKHTVICFNNGLHGWHLDSAQYENGLRKYVRFLKSNKTRECILVYLLTTPVSSEKEGEKC
jgi:hypothetical protein